MRSAWLIALTTSILIAGCADPRPTLPEPAAQQNEPGVSSFLLSRHVDDPNADIMLTLDTDVPIVGKISFSNMTKKEGNNGWGVSSDAMPHDFTNRKGASFIFYGDGKGTVALSTDGTQVEAGPPVLSTLREEYWQMNLSTMSGTWHLEPDHYHLIFGIDGASADLRIFLEAADGGLFRIQEDRDVGNIAVALTTSNPNDWDDRTEVWLTMAALVKANIAWEVQSPLNIGMVGGGIVEERTIRDQDGTFCATDGFEYRPGRGLIQIPPGSYQAETTAVLSAPGSGQVAFSFVQAPGHDEIEPMNICYA